MCDVRTSRNVLGKKRRSFLDKPRSCGMLKTMIHARQKFLICFILLSISTPSVGVERSVDASFKQDVVPILQKHCFACHNSEDRKGDFAIQTKAEVLESGYIESGKSEGGEIVAGGKCDNSSGGHFVHPTVFSKTKNDFKKNRRRALGPS